MNQQKTKHKEQTANLLERHKSHLTTTREWDRYARNHSLPSSSTLIKEFRTWNGVKSALGVSSINKRYSTEELMEIAKKHAEHFTTYDNWNRYASEHGLPVASTYLLHFDSWNQLKTFLGFPMSSQKWRKYTKEEITEIIKKHSSQFGTKEGWEDYAKENRLPGYRTILNYFTWDEVQKLAGAKKKRNYTEADLKEIAREHAQYFTTMSQWDKHAKENGLPSSMAYYRQFGSWNNAKANMFL